MKNLNGIWDDELIIKTKNLLDSQKNQYLTALDNLNKFGSAFSSYLSNSFTLFENLAGFFNISVAKIKKSSFFRSPKKILF